MATLRSKLPRNPERGSMLLWSIVSAAILAISLSAYLMAQRQAATADAAMRDEIQAQALAAELLEFFRAMTGVELNAYLQVNPVTVGGPPYPLCAHINLIDRKFSPTGSSTPIIFNRNPAFDLGATASLPTSNNSQLQPNRFAMVQVVDATTMAAVNSRCGLTNYVYNTATNPNERFLVTVGVTWVPAGKEVANAQRIVLSTLIPD